MGAPDHLAALHCNFCGLGVARRASRGAQISEPLRNRRPRLFERARAHEETDMSARRQLLLDPTLWGSDEGLRGEHLLLGRDVIALVGEALAGALVAHIAGEPWQDYAERRILRPLGMATATYREPYLDSV
jgi:hypothetical protein